MTLSHPRRELVVLALLLVVASSAFGQTYKPAAEYQSLLNMRFYEADGGFLVDGVQLVFPPQGVRRATFVLSKSGGGEVMSVPLRIEPFGAFPAFGMLVPDGNPGVVKVGQPGDFVITIKVNGEAVSVLPFSMKEEKSSDPFNPTRRFTREGLWRDLGFLSVRVDDADARVSFNWWMSLRELPAGVSRPLCTIHIMQGGQEIAASNSAVVPSSNDWQFLTRELVEAKTVGKPTRQYLTRAALTAKDGEFAVVVKVNGQPIKSYRMQVKGGQIQTLDRSRLGYEPSTDFISPRMIDTSAGTTSRYHMLESYWLKKSPK
ncbi:MAG TPA: hypothetical protein VGV59_04275 [Pyrinomonadaceae bacterium]|nr:hypothetical protein [Pyrinomonadaceae bacterium]